MLENASSRSIWIVVEVWPVQHRARIFKMNRRSVIVELGCERTPRCSCGGASRAKRMLQAVGVHLGDIQIVCGIPLCFAVRSNRVENHMLLCLG